MLQVKITRIAEYDGATYGVLSINGRPRFVTLEEAWKNNARGVSCIPKGEYRCSKYASKKFGDTFLVEEVPGRSGILFHWGNSIKDTEGCILVGTSYNPNLGIVGITNSLMAFRKFMTLVYPDTEFKLLIE